jgi:hypothetical protein
MDDSRGQSPNVGEHAQALEPQMLPHTKTEPEQTLFLHFFVNFPLKNQRETKGDFLGEMKMLSRPYT